MGFNTDLPLPSLFKCPNKYSNYLLTKGALLTHSFILPPPPPPPPPPQTAYQPTNQPLTNQPQTHYDHPSRRSNGRGYFSERIFHAKKRHVMYAWLAADQRQRHASLFSCFHYRSCRRLHSADLERTCLSCLSVCPA